MRRNRKTRTAELLYLLNAGPSHIENPRYKALHNLWVRTYVFPLVETLIPESRDMIDDQGKLKTEAQR
jgi:hypothetical protein